MVKKSTPEVRFRLEPEHYEALVERSQAMGLAVNKTARAAMSLLLDGDLSALLELNGTEGSHPPTVTQVGPSATAADILVLYEKLHLLIQRQTTLLLINPPSHEHAPSEVVAQVAKDLSDAR